LNFLIKQTVSSKCYAQVHLHWQTHYECKCLAPFLSQTALMGANLSHHKQIPHRRSAASKLRSKQISFLYINTVDAVLGERYCKWITYPKRWSLTPQRLKARVGISVLIHRTTFRILLLFL
jgi:hypothetical protein